MYLSVLFSRNVTPYLKYGTEGRELSWTKAAIQQFQEICSPGTVLQVVGSQPLDGELQVECPHCPPESLQRNSNQFFSISPESSQ